MLKQTLIAAALCILASSANAQTVVKYDGQSSTFTADEYREIEEFERDFQRNVKPHLRRNCEQQASRQLTPPGSHKPMKGGPAFQQSVRTCISALSNYYLSTYKFTNPAITIVPTSERK